jgi:hypothetical protein
MSLATHRPRTVGELVDLDAMISELPAPAL